MFNKTQANESLDTWAYSQYEGAGSIRRPWHTNCKLHKSLQLKYLKYKMPTVNAAQS